MRKLACTAILLAAAALAAPAQAQTVPTRATLEACHAGDAPLERFAIFSAQMAALPGTQKMQLRFDLFQRLPGDDFRRVKAPGLGVWRSSVPGVDIFRYRKQVANLAAPGAYRAVIRFRWLDAGGDVVEHTTRRTRTCKQPDLRPDLDLDGVKAQPAGQGRARYTMVVSNDGRSTTPGFGVTLAVGDQVLPAQAVTPLAPGADRTLTFFGPRCDRGSSLKITLDTGLVVDESDEGDNVRLVPCPL